MNGPTELRVFTRLENTPEMRGRILYRIQVRSQNKIINTFQLSSRRSHITTYHQDSNLVPGQAAEVVIAVPEGKHLYEIHGLDQQYPFLARFMIPKSDLWLTGRR